MRSMFMPFFCTYKRCHLGHYRLLYIAILLRRTPSQSSSDSEFTSSSIASAFRQSENEAISHLRSSVSFLQRTLRSLSLLLQTRHAMIHTALFITHPPTTHVSNCHFCNPPRWASLVGACLEAILTSAVCIYFCASAAQTFLCALVSAFLQSREQ